MKILPPLLKGGCHGVTGGIKNKLKEKLETNKELAFISKTLRNNKYRCSSRKKFRRDKIKRI